MFNELTITLTCQNNRKEQFDIYTLARWLSFIEAFEHIAKFTESNNIKLGDLKSPLSLFDYINARQPYHEEKLVRLIEDCNFLDDRLFEF